MTNAANAVFNRNEDKEMTTLGIGWRPELALAIERRNDIDFVEVLFENTDPHDIPQALLNLKTRGVEIIPHAVSISLGGADRPNVKRIREWNKLATQLQSPYVSEHIAFVRSGGKESGHLLPVPRTKNALRILIDNISITKEHLTVPLVLENIAMLCDWKNSEMDEASFITAVLEATDSMLLLDVANLYANSVNHGFDAERFLKNIPLDRIAYVHTAGGITTKGTYHDTHAHPVAPAVHNLLEMLMKLANPPKVMLERDDNFGSTEELYAELDQISKLIKPALNVGAR